MPLTPITLRSTREPFRLRLASTSQSCVQVVAPATVTFLDDSTTVSYQPGSAPSAVAQSIYDGSTTIDGTADNWLLLAVKGTAYPVWVKERDFGTIETLVSAKGWAPLRMLAEGRLSPLFLESQEVSFPAGVKGDILYDNGTAWVVRHIGNPTDVLYVDPVSGVPIWEPLSALATLIGPLLPTTPNTPVVLSSGAGVCLSLWNGSGNLAVPDGWTTLGFDESGWHAPVVKPAGPGDEGFFPLWPESTALSLSERALFRQHFTVPTSGPIRSATLFAIGNQSLYGVWINGNPIPNTTGSGIGNPTQPHYTVPNISLSPSLFLPGQDNVLAVEGGDPEGLGAMQSAVVFNVLALF